MKKLELQKLQQEYYEGLFKHRREVEEIYDTPLVSGKALLVFLGLLALVVYLVIRLG